MSIKKIVQNFDDWLRSDKNLKFDENDWPENFIFVTCGDWDLRKMLPGQCNHFNLKHANYFKKWINIKKVDRVC